MRASNGGEEARSELDKYINEEIEQDENLDILEYWKVNSSRFPILSRMALYPSPRWHWSRHLAPGGRVLDPFKSSLTLRIVQSLICTKDWLRASFATEKISVEEDLSNLEKLELGLNKVALVTEM